MEDDAKFRDDLTRMTHVAEQWGETIKLVAAPVAQYYRTLVDHGASEGVARELTIRFQDRMLMYLKIFR